MDWATFWQIIIALVLFVSLGMIVVAMTLAVKAWKFTNGLVKKGDKHGRS